MSDTINLAPTPSESVRIGAVFLTDLIHAKVRPASRVSARGVLDGLIEIVRVLAVTDAKDGTDYLGAMLRQAASVSDPVEDRWAEQSEAFHDEHPWCGWTMAFAADSDWDTTGFALQGLVGINLLLTTADGRSRPVRLVDWQRRVYEPDTDTTAGIVVREVDNDNYEPLPDKPDEVVFYADIRELVVF